MLACAVHLLSCLIAYFHLTDKRMHNLTPWAIYVTCMYLFLGSSCEGHMGKEMQQVSDNEF